MKYLFLILFLVFGTFLDLQTEVYSQNKPFEAQYESLQKASYNDNNYEKLLNQTIESATIENNIEGLAKTYTLACYYYTDFKNVLYFADLLHDLGKKENQIEWMATALQMKGYAYFLEKDYAKSIGYDLQALDLFQKIDKIYEYNKSLYNIASAKMYLMDYKNALELFKQTSKYFSEFESYSKVLGFFNSKRMEAMCHIYLYDYEAANSALKQYELEFHRLREEDLKQEKAYYLLTKGIIQSEKKEFKNSNESLEKSLVEIRNNEDYVNEQLIHLYLGINYWNLKEYEKSVVYFKKIDGLFKDKKYISLELIRAYDYLISYSQTKEDLKNELYYTNQLVEATKLFQKQNTHLSSTLLKDSENKTSQLLQNKEQLINELEYNKTRNLYIIIIGLLSVLLLSSYLIYTIRKNKQLRKTYESLLLTYDQKLNSSTVNQIITPEIELNTTNVFVESTDDLPTEKEQVIENEEIVTINETEKCSIDCNEIPEKLILELNTQVSVFETNKEYLNPNLSLAQLATDWNTNRTYLSKYFNSVKGKSFNTYINDLRIEYAIVSLKNNPKLRRYSIDALALEFGYNKRRNFSEVFIKKTGLTPSYYIKQLNIDEDLV